MSIRRKKTFLILGIFILLTSLSCALPEAAIITPTNQPSSSPVPAITSTVLPIDSFTPTVSRMTSTPRPTTLPIGQHSIAIHRIYGLAEFYNRTTGSPFTPRGVTYSLLVPVLDHYEDRLLAVGIYDHNRIQSDFAKLASAGYNTIRITLDGCTSGDTCIGLQDGQGLNPAYMDNMTDLLDLAKANHLFVLVASQGLPELGGYAALANQGVNASYAAGRNAQLLTEAGVHASQQYWADILIGLASREAAFDVIFSWELLSEQYFDGDQMPFSMQSGRVIADNGKDYDMARPSQREALAVDSLRHYVDQVKQTILAYDPTALISMGFLAPDSPNAWREDDTRYSVTAPILQDSALDFFDLHASPGSGLTMDELPTNFGLGGHVTQPVILGEVGASTWSYPQISDAAIAVQDWISASCAHGFGGWLYSSFYPSPAGLPTAAWGFTEAQDTILNALAPKRQLDACSVTILPGRNLALGKLVQVSAALPDQLPEMAVDGDPNTQWSAGAYPAQWIEIDLGASTSIGEIRMTVGQWPDGKTMHQLWVGTSQDALRLVQEFSGHTSDFDVLSYFPSSPMKGIRYVRLVTSESPAWVAWREIEVLAPFPATPTPQQTPTP